MLKGSHFLSPYVMRLPYNGCVMLMVRCPVGQFRLHKHTPQLESCVVFDAMV